MSIYRSAPLIKRPPPTPWWKWILAQLFRRTITRLKFAQGRRRILLGLRSKHACTKCLGGSYCYCEWLKELNSYGNDFRLSLKNALTIGYDPQPILVNITTNTIVKDGESYAIGKGSYAIGEGSYATGTHAFAIGTDLSSSDTLSVPPKRISDDPED